MPSRFLVSGRVGRTCTSSTSPTCVKDEPQGVADYLSSRWCRHRAGGSIRLRERPASSAVPGRRGTGHAGPRRVRPAQNPVVHLQPGASLDTPTWCCATSDVEIDKGVADPHPDVVFHAAALKHLPARRQYPLEGWRPTSAPQRAAHRSGVQRHSRCLHEQGRRHDCLGRPSASRRRPPSTPARPVALAVLRFGCRVARVVLHTFTRQIGPVTVTIRDHARDVPARATIVSRCHRAARRMGEDSADPGCRQGPHQAAPARTSDIFTGLRPNEKMHEVFSDDRPHPTMQLATVVPRWTRSCWKPSTARSGVVEQATHPAQRQEPADGRGTGPTRSRRNQPGGPVTSMRISAPRPLRPDRHHAMATGLGGAETVTPSHLRKKNFPDAKPPNPWRWNGVGSVSLATAPTTAAASGGSWRTSSAVVGLAAGGRPVRPDAVIASSTIPLRHLPGAAGRRQGAGPTRSTTWPLTIELGGHSPAALASRAMAPRAKSALPRQRRPARDHPCRCAGRRPTSGRWGSSP